MPDTPAKPCPEGYTRINGECVKDVTPPPPGGDNSVSVSETDKEDED